jgi:hypothetical protein
MSFILSLLASLGSFFSWLSGRTQRQIGREQQQNDDAQATIKTLEAEKDAAAQRSDILDKLRQHDL